MNHGSSLMDGGQAAVTVLECVDSIPCYVGKTKIARLLKGSESKELNRLDLARVRHYGAFQRLTIAQIEAVIEQLVGHGCLRRSRGRRPVLMVSAIGRSAIVSGAMPEVEVPDALRMFMARERCRKCPHNPEYSLFDMETRRSNV
ncbi:MAG: RQC domain-containing protein [Clostridia bacterium]|nr:RQC domain-containing protein [Clostridia bacterium]